jgi:outer membrane protein assembly factor BamE
MFHSLQKTVQLSHFKRSGLNALALVAVLALWSCGYSPVKIYQPEVVQGNFVSKEQVQALRAGMPRQAVRDILGTPLVTSVFHAERWDYAFTIRRQGSEPQLRRFTVYFKGDVLDRVDGDPLPTEAEFAAKLDTRRPPSKLPELKASPEELAKLPPKSSAATSNPNASAATPPASYPPLEGNTR